MQFNARLNRWVNDADDVMLARETGFEHVNKPLYHVLRRIDPDVIEAVCLLQEKAAWDASMAEHYKADYMKAEETTKLHGLTVEFWKGNALEYWHKEAKASARASACARNLMGIE